MNQKNNDQIKKHFDAIASQYDLWKKKSWYYYEILKNVYKEFVPPNSTVLELGCGAGDILASLKPKKSVGIDISPLMIKSAKSKFPKLDFYVGNVMLPFKIKGKFSRIVIPDLIEHVNNPKIIFHNARKFIRSDGLIIVSSANPIWRPLLEIAEHFGLKMPEGPHFWVSSDYLKRALIAEKFAIIVSGYRLLIPKYIPFISKNINNLITKSSSLNRLCLIQYVVAAPKAVRN